MNSPLPDKNPKAAKHAREGKKNRELAAEVQSLRQDVDALKAAVAERGGCRNAPPSPERASLEAALQERLDAPSDAALLYAFALRLESPDGGVTVTGSHQSEGLDTLLTPSDERVARIGYALSSVPKVALLRLLLSRGPQSAAQLGDQAGLSTGSLYHHLRELVHSGAIRQTGRSLYALTPLGHHLTMLLFSIAGGNPE